MRVIVVDGDAAARNRVKRYLNELDDVNIAEEFSDTESALSFAENEHADLVCIDAAMSEGSGLELAESLKDLDDDIEICIISESDKFLREANRLNAQYLLQPVTRMSVSQMIENVQARLQYKMFKNNAGGGCSEQGFYQNIWSL